MTLQGLPNGAYPAAKSAFSLAEMIVVVGVIAVVGAMVIGAVSGFTDSSKAGVAERNLSILNEAVNAFKSANWEIVLSPTPDGADETAVFYTLQYRDPVMPASGSPYLSLSLKPALTSQSSAYRAVWNGRYFQTVKPGIAATGLDLEHLQSSPGSGPPRGFTPVRP